MRPYMEKLGFAPASFFAFIHSSLLAQDPALGACPPSHSQVRQTSSGLWRPNIDRDLAPHSALPLTSLGYRGVKCSVDVCTLCRFGGCRDSAKPKPHSPSNLKLRPALSAGPRRLRIENCLRSKTYIPDRECATSCDKPSRLSRKSPHFGRRAAVVVS